MVFRARRVYGSDGLRWRPQWSKRSDDRRAGPDAIADQA